MERQEIRADRLGRLAVSYIRLQAMCKRTKGLSSIITARADAELRDMYPPAFWLGSGENGAGMANEPKTISKTSKVAAVKGLTSGRRPEMATMQSEGV